MLRQGCRLHWRRRHRATHNLAAGTGFAQPLCRVVDAWPPVFRAESLFCFDDSLVVFVCELQDLAAEARGWHDACATEENLADSYKLVAQWRYGLGR